MADDAILWDYPLANSLEGRLLTATLERLKGLTLPCIENDRVVIRKLPWDMDLTPPYVTLSPGPESTPWDAGTNEKEEPTFSFLVAIVLANSRDVTTRGMGLQLAWRQTIRRAFHNPLKSDFNPALETGEFFIHCYVESGDKFIEAAKRLQFDAQYYVLRFRCREPRE